MKITEHDSTLTIDLLPFILRLANSESEYNMNSFESVICNMAEDKTSWEIESLISELQMIADRKYDEEEWEYNELFQWVTESLAKLSIIK